MAQYKVPQDVEADDKLLGPFSFRQFVYLMIAAGLIALAVGLFQLFPLLAIIPLPPVLLFVALALPLRKDQPMETYLTALVSYYLKPRTRTWEPGQRESTIQVIAPKVVEEKRTRDITGEEATHRLSFLADIVDTEGYAIKGGTTGSSMREDLVAEANTAEDIFETGHFDNLSDTIAKDENARHEEVVKEMRAAIDNSDEVSFEKGIQKDTNVNDSNGAEDKVDEKSVEDNNDVENENKNENDSQNLVKPSIMELANNSDYSVATIAKEAERINKKDEEEVFVSLH